MVAIIGGVLLFVLLIGPDCSISNTAKVIGYGRFCLPSRLGWVALPGPQSIQQLDLVSTPQDMAFYQAGSCLVFTSNFDLLLISMQLENSPTVSWLHLAGAHTGDPARAEFITWGLLPYDSPLAQGRPVARFTIDKPGLYRLSFPTPPGVRLDFVPDTTTGKEWLIWVNYLVEVGLVLGIPGWSYVRRWRRGANELAALRKPQRARGGPLRAGEERPGRAGRPGRLVPESVALPSTALFEPTMVPSLGSTPGAQGWPSPDEGRLLDVHRASGHGPALTAPAPTDPPGAFPCKLEPRTRSFAR